MFGPLHMCIFMRSTYTKMVYVVSLLNLEIGMITSDIFGLSLSVCQSYTCMNGDGCLWVAILSYTFLCLQLWIGSVCGSRMCVNGTGGVLLAVLVLWLLLCSPVLAAMRPNSQLNAGHSEADLLCKESSLCSAWRFCRFAVPVLAAMQSNPQLTR